MKWMYILGGGLLCFLAGCALQPEEKLGPDGAGGEQAVYLSMTRAQAAQESINEDVADYEDRVHDFTLLVFDSNTGAKTGEYYEASIPASETSKTFTVKLTPGTHDFYFVANLSSPLAEIGNRTEMEEYMQALRNLEEGLYQGAAEGKGFPMSRVYKNQTIASGGSIYDPLPFKPGGEDRIRLIRIAAKLEVNFAGWGDAIDHVSYRNAYRQYSLERISALPSPVYYEDKPLKKIDDDTYIYYMPEVILPAETLWGSGNHRPVNYFVIKTTAGTEYEVPIVTYDGAEPIVNYMKFARGNQADKPDYSIYRNHHYRYTINKLQTIEILYNVLEWNVVNKSTFMGYWYNVEVGGDEITIRNTVKACPPHKVTLKALAPYTFAGGETEKTFTDAALDASVIYKLNTIPVSGEAYLEVYYNDILVKTFSN